MAGVVLSKNKNKKILLCDIETMANLAWVWGIYEQNVIAKEKEWHMLSFAYKWLDEKKTYVRTLPDYPGYAKNKECDKALVSDLWKLFNEADVIIAHNGDSFDIKKSNARFIANGLPPPSPYKTIDTKLVARRYFKFDSNKLDTLGEMLGLGRKLQTGGFDLWLGCARGDKKSWKKMAVYNLQDVRLLEKVYLKLRAWMNNHPVVDFDAVCKCGSNDVELRGPYRTKKRFGKRFQCKQCGAWGHTFENGKQKN